MHWSTTTNMIIYNNLSATKSTNAFFSFFLKTLFSPACSRLLRSTELPTFFSVFCISFSGNGSCLKSSSKSFIAVDLMVTMSSGFFEDNSMILDLISFNRSETNKTYLDKCRSLFLLFGTDLSHQHTVY